MAGQLKKALEQSLRLFLQSSTMVEMLFGFIASLFMKSTTNCASNLMITSYSLRDTHSLIPSRNDHSFATTLVVVLIALA